MDNPNTKKQMVIQKLMSPWVLGIVSMILIGGAGALSALVAVGMIKP